MDTGQTDITL